MLLMVGDRELLMPANFLLEELIIHLKYMVLKQTESSSAIAST
jgi:hypothetical protein